MKCFHTASSDENSASTSAKTSRASCWLSWTASVMDLRWAENASSSPTMTDEELSGGRVAEVGGDDAAAAAAAAAASMSSSIFSIKGALTARQLIKSVIYLQQQHQHNNTKPYAREYWKRTHPLNSTKNSCFLRAAWRSWRDQV